MKKGAVVKVDKVMPFSPPESKGEYSSKMLIDESNSGSKRLQINHGTLKAGCSTGPGVHKPPYDEIYYVLSGEAVLHMDGVDYDIDKDIFRRDGKICQDKQDLIRPEPCIM